MPHIIPTLLTAHRHSSLRVRTTLRGSKTNSNADLLRTSSSKATTNNKMNTRVVRSNSNKGTINSRGTTEVVSRDTTNTRVATSRTLVISNNSMVRINNNSNSNTRESTFKTSIAQLRLVQASSNSHNKGSMPAS